MIWNQILCLGDSLTYGARDRYGRSYPAELGKILSDKLVNFTFATITVLMVKLRLTYLEGLGVSLNQTKNVN